MARVQNRTYADIMSDRRHGIMHVPYEGYWRREWRRYSRTLPGMQTLRQARASQAAAAALADSAHPERLGWSEATR